MPKASPGRLVLGTLAAAMLGCCGWWLLRVDTQYGPPLGPDRVLAKAEGGNPSAMAEGARQALHSRPIDGSAFRMLGMVAAKEGANDRANELYRIAVRRDPRDWRAHAFLMDAAFRRGAVEEGVKHLDALLRVNPDLAAPLLESLAADLGNERLRSAVIASVVEATPWEGQLLTALRSTKTDAKIAALFIQELSVRKPLKAAERSALIDVLSRTGRASEARSTWLASLSAKNRGLADNVFDGSFEEAEPITGEFAWTWDSGPGVDVAIVRGDAASGHQFARVDFSGRAATVHAPSQRITLDPGTYTLSTSFDDQTNAPRPFVLVITCVIGGELAGLELSGGERGAWTDVIMSFDVPPGCTQQRVGLAQRARSMADTQISGLLRLDGIRIRKTLQ